MNILLVNDDGYNSEGITLIKELLKKYGTVYMCAPKYHQSGKSAAFTYLGGLKVEKVDDFNYIVDGTPVDCVAFATNVIPVKFDVVISGCNNGLNMTYDCYYSGTIGACKEALLHNIPSIAFSTQVKHFEIVKNEFDQAMRYIIDNSLLSSDYLLNVNFPDKPFMFAKGIKLTTQHIRKDKFFHEYRNGLYYLDRHEGDDYGDENTDVFAVKNGYISITPLNMTSFNKDTYLNIKKKRAL